MEEVQVKQSFFKKWLPLLVLGLAVLIIVIDTTLLNVSLGSIIRDLGTTLQSLQWVIAAYSLTLAALTITGGRLGDLFGRKKMFITGAIIFAGGSFIASISHSVGHLLIGESIIEGMGAALMMPATASLLIATYRGRDRAVALGIWGGMAAAGSAFGPLIGGYLTSHYSWRWGFRINVVIAALLVLGSVIIKESRDQEEKPKLDWVGVFLSASGLFAGVFAIIEASTYGWWKAMKTFELTGHAIGFGGLSIVPIALVASFILLTLFVLWEQRIVKVGKTPLVSMKIFANKQFTSGAMTTGILSMGQVGLIFALPVFLQGVRGLDALHTGYAMVPLSIGLFIMAPLGGFLSKKFKPKHIVQVGFLLNVIGLLLLRYSLSVHATSSDFILPLGVYGAGVGLCFSQLTNLTLSAVSVNEAGEASGVNNTIRQVGSSLGSAIIGVILLTTLSSNLHSRVHSSSVLPESSKVAIADEVAAQSSAVEFGVPISSKVQLSSQEKKEIKNIANQSTVDSNKSILLVTVGFTILAFLASTQLPNTHNIEKDESLAPAGAH